MMARSRHLEQGWFRVEAPEQGIFTIEEPLHVEAVKSYLVLGSERAVLIDTGMGVGDIKKLAGTLTKLPLIVLNSHSHWDHIGGSHAFQGTSEILIHRSGDTALRRGVDNAAMRRFLSADQLLAPLPDSLSLATVSIPGTQATRLLDGGEILDLGDRQLEIMPTPGHAPDLIVVLDREREVLFSTDAAYAGALYAQMAESDLSAYATTMRQLSQLASSLRTVYPSHGTSPIAPALLPRMSEVIDAAVAGRPPDRVAEGVGTIDGDGFSLLIAAAPEAGSSPC